MNKKLLLLLIIPLLSFGQQSKNYQSRPNNVSIGDIKKSDFLNQNSIVLIPDVPSYTWYRGCAPTCLGMIVGYYDEMGYQDLIPGLASSQNDSVNNCIASDDHYNNYSLPIDNFPNLLEDASSIGGAHQNNCIADFMQTSFSSVGNYWGWSWGIDVGNAFINYVDYKNNTYVTSSNYYINNNNTWYTYRDEINANRPTMLLVDSDGDGETDHFLVGIGYNSLTLEFAAYDTWDNEIHWYSWQPMNNGVEWGVWALITFAISQDCLGNYDECGVCNGIGPELYYDCFGNCINDVDNDEICDELDECVGEYDECGMCNGNGPQLYYDCNGNCISDIDVDDVCDELDNCPENYNPNQEDGNIDGVGDACDGIGLDEGTIERVPIKVVDLLGREIVKENKNVLLLYIYNDGSVEKKCIVE